MKCLYCFALAVVPMLLQAQAAPKQVLLKHWDFTGLAHLDGNWAALLAARDGMVYVGLAHHGGDGHLVVFNPKSGRMHDTGRLTELCGEQSLGRSPQAKIHTKFGEGPDGRIFFATHYSIDFNFTRHGMYEGYPGAHWMSFDPRTRRVEDFGIGLPHDGLITGAYDPVFQRIYAISDPRGHFVYFDVATKATVDKGRINNPESLCRTLGVDDQGNVFGTFGMGQIFRYDPRTGKLRELSVRLPIREKGRSLGRDYFKSETGWRVVVWDRQTRRFYGVEESASTLFSFDPNRGPDGEVVRLGQMAVPALAGTRDVPYATLSLALAPDRKLYFAAAGREFDYSASAGLAASHLMVHNLNTGNTEDLGEMRLADGRLVIGTNSADPAPDGTIYFVGAVEVRPVAG
ncbi:MAG: hypothetical protein NTY38_00090, partial [Acidobacteria bacterium]|nr:hypothetical protein [Acidobacteriota bacterium]